MIDQARSFENPQTPSEALPDYRALVFEPVAAGFRGYVAVTTLVYWLPPSLFVGLGNLIPGVTLLPGLVGPAIVLLIGLLVGMYRGLDADRRGWALRAHDIAARSGIVWRSITVLPFARIQHVETTSGPLERRRGLARLKLFTAGGSSADLTLIGLDATTADRLREHLAEQIRQRDAGAAEEGAGAAASDDLADHSANGDA
ncbi:MAG: PH domain-containing protein [Wenzhouxiangellaceae bacterium]|nr:PH domain-containing protein [Wenzhouxiangellaceae bacterium]